MLFFENSPWLIFTGIFAGGLFAWLLYGRKNPWNKKTSWLLGGLRFMLVFLVILLILGPLIKHMKRTTEEASVVIAIDNSTSISIVTDSASRINLLEKLSGIGNQLIKNGIRVEYMDIGGNKIMEPADIRFDQQRTDFSVLMQKINASWESRNLAAVIVVSDGIINSGTSPLYANYNFPVYTVGIGDSTEKDDISIQEIIHNKVAYQGNQFQVEVELFNKGYAGEKTRIEIYHDGKAEDSREVTFINERGIQMLQLTANAGEKGIQRFIVKAGTMENEHSAGNNTREIYIDVVESKQKILLLAHSPHPDIKAIRNALEKNENYELDIVLPGKEELMERQYDIVIYHQIPDASNTFRNLIEPYNLQDLPSLYIIGSKTSLNILNNQLEWINIQVRSAQRDNTFPSLNQNFTGYNFEERETDIFNDYPPLSSPFADYTLTGENDVLLFQRIGSLTTSKPLFVFHKSGDVKNAVLAGEGIWRWRLHEFLVYKSHENFDYFFSRAIQYLGARDDKRRFKVYPVKNEFNDTESVLMETEIYNEIYERIYGQEITLLVTGEDKNQSEFSYVTSETNSRFRMGNFKPGIYNFQASTTIGNEPFSSSGIFTVKQLRLETRNLTADFALLREWSSKSSGKFFSHADLENFDILPVIESAKPVIYSAEDITAMINLKWIFFLLLLLITIEWSARKYLGGY